MSVQGCYITLDVIDLLVKDHSKCYKSVRSMDASATFEDSNRCLDSYGSCVNKSSICQCNIFL